MSALDKLARKVRKESAPAVDVPSIKSFEHFLTEVAMVPTGKGEYGKFSFEGREALYACVRRLDRVIKLGIPDVILSLAGGAQWGKTTLQMNLLAWACACAWLRMGLYGPDDAIMENLVDTKFRPDVVQQISWLARLIQVGKAISNDGKSVNRKNAFTITDGRRKTYGMTLGLQKPATSFTFDLAGEDEVDDIPEKYEASVAGRLTSSALRLIFKIGTQRVAGRGQHKQWKDGSQGVMLLFPSDALPVGLSAGADVEEMPVAMEAEGGLVPEEKFPQIFRLALKGESRDDDPRLTWAGTWVRPQETKAVAVGHDPDWHYYLACPETGRPLQRSMPIWAHRHPQRIKMHPSYRIAQLGIGAIDLRQIVNSFAGRTGALTDGRKMTFFRCDRLAMPQSETQALSAEVIERARTVETFDLGPVATRYVRYGGVDAGDAWWFIVRELDLETGVKRVIAVEKIASHDAETRICQLFKLYNLRALFLDQRPDINAARRIAAQINGIADARMTLPATGMEHSSSLRYQSGLSWNGNLGRWLNLKCAVVRFDKKRPGSGIEHALDRYPTADGERAVPVVLCNRYETIDNGVREFLTPAEGVHDVLPNNGGMRANPALLLPRNQPGADPLLSVLDEHLLVGSEKDGTGDYLDQIQNHLLLANCYSLLAETECGAANTAPAQGYKSISRSRRAGGRNKGRASAV